jgi:RNA polymerase sigma-32 factor
MHRFDDGRTAIAMYLSDIHRTELLDRGEENELARRWTEHRDDAAAAELVRRNLRFVVKVALGYRKYRLPLADLVQEGNLGLIRAVEKFDPSRGTRLISYAVWWIKAYIQAYVIQTWSLVRVGTTQVQRRLFYKLPRALAESPPRGEPLEARLERIAGDLRARPADVLLMMNALKNRDLSLDAPVDPEGETSWLDRVEDEGKDPESAATERWDSAWEQDVLRRAVSRLGRREREIIRLRHQQEEPMTLREVGDALGLSRERVRQLEAQALRKLKSIVAPQLRRAQAA